MEKIFAKHICVKVLVSQIHKEKKRNKKTNNTILKMDQKFEQISYQKKTNNGK